MGSSYTFLFKKSFNVVYKKGAYHGIRFPEKKEAFFR